MAPTPFRIAQTSSEAKKQHKKNGPRLPERQQKQLERAHELDVRAARLREAEHRRRAAKKKREEREVRERAARQQTGVGLATQLIGYSHTQAQLKSGMEAFLGVKKCNEAEQRGSDMAASRQLEALAQKVDKEPWDDDDDDEDIALALPQSNVSFGDQYADDDLDDDLDDDSLLQAHDMAVSDPPIPPHAHLEQLPLPEPASVALSKPGPTRDDADFLRLHGPVHKAAEAILEKMPEPLIELLSQDISPKLPDWDPAPGLLHKLNPLGLPPHRLRIKVGCFVTLLQHLDTRSRLPKGQHLQILRIENDRLECLVLDGQREPTKAFLTRTAFSAKYRNDDARPFRRVQFPIRLTTNHKAQPAERPTSQSVFELPIIPGNAKIANKPTRSGVPASKWGFKMTANHSSDFKLPRPPASKRKTSSALNPYTAPANVDCWDDFFESGTQIARELSSEVIVSTVTSHSAVGGSNLTSECLVPLSTQDLDFSIEDLKEAVMDHSSKPPLVPLPDSGRLRAMNFTSRPHSPKRATFPVNLDAIRPSQRPPSVSDRPGLKRRPFSPPSLAHPPPTKRHRMLLSSSKSQRVESEAETALRLCGTARDIGMSTQEVASFFAEEADMAFGSPPVAV